MWITGFWVFSSNSEELASFNPKTSLAYSTTAICIPKQIPKNGTLFSLAYFIVWILPSIPLLPNPPGTTIPSYFCRTSFAFSLVIFSEFTNSTLTFTWFANPAWYKLSITDIYESSSFTYFPTIAIFTILFLSIALISSIIFCHLVLSGIYLSSFKWLHASRAKPSSSSINGTAYKQSAVLFSITLVFLTLQNKDNFSLTESGISNSVLQTIMSGLIPKLCNSFTECCVGFDFISFEPDIYGNNVTCIYNTSSGFFSNPTCLIASIIDSPSISPIVPPTSVITISVSVFSNP